MKLFLTEDWISPLLMLNKFVPNLKIIEISRRHGEPPCRGSPGSRSHDSVTGVYQAVVAILLNWLHQLSFKHKSHDFNSKYDLSLWGNTFLYNVYELVLLLAMD